jgi:5'(3')-deoxyribonucleotidase
MRKNIIVYVDMDEVLCDFYGAHKAAIEKTPEQKYPQAAYGFFANLEPLPNAIEGYKFLDTHFRVHILTAPSVDNPMCYTEKRMWVEKHLGKEAAKRMVITGYKNLLRGNYLIDDNAYGKGQDTFSGELLHFGQNDLNWVSIINYFATKYLQK